MLLVLPLSLLAGACKPESPTLNVQVGPRPYFPDFSIGHRGAPLQFPEHTRESYVAAARQGAGILECDVTFKPFQPANPETGQPASALCCTSDITLAEFKQLCGELDAFNLGLDILRPLRLRAGEGPNHHALVATERDSAELRRTLGFFAITVYAVGDILGAGIYALVGRVAGVAGGGAWVSFLVSALVAGLTGLTYAEWVSRVPVAAGAAAYSHRAFGRPFVAFLVGFLVLASGITSAAAVSHAFVGYLDTFVQLPRLLSAVGLLALLSGLNYRGIRDSSRVNIVLTSVELSGLLLVIIAGLVFVSGRPAGELLPSLAPTTGAGGVLGGVTLAFYAYVGFEDTVNVAQEVREPERNLPRAILLALAFTTLVYLLVTVAALLTVPLDRLASSEAPLLEVLAAAGLSVPPEVFALIALLAITNTGLLNLIMASRLMWGMSRDGLLPRVFLRVAPARRTPSVAILAAFGLAVLLAVSGTTSLLAQTTSLLLLLVFTTVHVGLIVVRRREPGPAGSFRTAGWTPWLGALTCAGLCLRYTAEVYLRAGLLLLLGVLAWVLMRPRSR